MKITKITNPKQDKWEPKDRQHKTQIDPTPHYKNHNIPSTGWVGARGRTNPKHKGGYTPYKNEIKNIFHNMNTDKKGFMRTMEGALSLIILLTFLFHVIPHIPNEQRISAQTRNFIMLSIENLDKNKTLDTHLITSTPNLQAIKNALNKTISSDINYTIGAATSNATADTVFSEESYTGSNITYTSNNTNFKDAYIILTFTNATNPQIHANTQQIYTYTGTHPQDPLKLDLTPYTKEGSNKIEIKTQNNATVEYILITNNKELLSPIPNDKPVGVVTYILSGKENLFQPTVLEIYLWR